MQYLVKAGTFAGQDFSKNPFFEKVAFKIRIGKKLVPSNCSDKNTPYNLSNELLVRSGWHWKHANDVLK